MGMYLNLGNAGFQSIRKSLYVDKSGLISFINKTLGTANKLTCVSRPRRFGKSYAAQMLCAYYDKSCVSGALFEDLEIAKDASYEKYLNQFDVIYLDITWFISTCENKKEVVKYLQEQVIQELCEKYPSVAGTKSLPLALSKANNMTGILPIKKYGTQSTLTDFREYTMLNPEKLEAYVGFTESEVEKLCSEYNMDFEEAKRWYDGYSFHKVKSVYNPNAVIRAMENGRYGTYWTQTETYESLKIYIDMDEDGLKEAIVSMLGKNTCPVDVMTFQNDITSIQSKDDVLTLLVHLGYLAYDADTHTVRIPNEEIRQEFIRAVKNGRHTEIAKLIRESDQLLQYTLNMEEEKVAAAIERAHSVSTAPVFYNNEQALRSVIRFAYISCVEEFKDIQELPSGIGYADIVYLPKKNSIMPIIVVELKWNKKADGAIDQIKKRNYPQIFDGYGSDILLVGISYNEKTKKHDCKIEKIVKNNTL